jgi:hypothetical protein
MIFLFPKKLLHAFSNACQVFLSAEINWFLKVRLLKWLFYLRTGENASLVRGNLCLKYTKPSPSLFIAFTNI